LGVPCPRCGREARVLVGGLCPSCFAEVHGLARLPQRVEVEICRYCYSVRLGGRWVPVSSFEEAVWLATSRAVERARPMDPLEGVELVGVDYETLPNWSTRVSLRLRGRYRGLAVEGTQQLLVRFKATVCPVCKVRVSGEYDTVLQVRGGDPGRVEGEVYRIIGEEGLAGQTVDLIRTRDGVDVYFTNPGAARKLAKRLRNRVGGRIEGVHHETVGRNSRGRMRSRRTMVLRIEDKSRGEDSGGSGQGGPA